MNRTILIFICLLFVGCSKQEYNYTSVWGVAYDTFPKTKLDIHVPLEANQNNPVIIYVHGGGWKSGDKSEWDIPKIEYFCNLGYICVSINYRLSPDVKHPTHIQDVANAINWVEDNISRYGGDRSKITLVGHSAGAHLTALVVTNQKYLNKAGVDIHNIKTAYILDAGAYLIMNKQVYDDINILNMIYGAVGDDMNSDLWKDFAPYNYINADKYIPNLIIAHSDAQYRCNANSLFCSKLDECNKDYIEYILAGYSHSDVLLKFPYYIDINMLYNK